MFNLWFSPRDLFLFHKKKKAFLQTDLRSSAAHLSDHENNNNETEASSHT